MEGGTVGVQVEGGAEVAMTVVPMALELLGKVEVNMEMEAAGEVKKALGTQATAAVLVASLEALLEVERAPGCVVEVAAAERALVGLVRAEAVVTEAAVVDMAAHQVKEAALAVGLQVVHANRW